MQAAYCLFFLFDQRNPVVHFENIPVWVWAILGAFVLLAYVFWQIERIKLGRFHRDVHAYRARNKALEMAWNLRWRPRPKRIGHDRRNGDNQR